MGIKLELDLLRKRETVGCVCAGYFEMYFLFLRFLRENQSGERGIKKATVYTIFPIWELEQAQVR